MQLHLQLKQKLGLTSGLTAMEGWFECRGGIGERGGGGEESSGGGGECVWGMWWEWV